MKKGIAIGLGVIGLLALASKASSLKGGLSGAPAQARPARLLLIGDSLAVGLRAPLAALAASSGVPFEGHGIVGTRIDQWAGNAKLDQYLATFKPTHVLVSLGTNDENVGTGWAAKEAPKLHALLDKIRAAGAEVLWIGPPSLPFPRVGVSDMVKGLVERYYPSELLQIERSPDKLHPTLAGYAAWAAQIWKWVTS